MGRSRVLMPLTTRLPLSDGDYLEVKQDLNAGEYFDLLTDMAARRPFSKAIAYIVAWSLVGLDGHPLPYALSMPEQDRRDTIRSLDKYTMREVQRVLDQHEEAAEAEHEAKKKTNDGKAESSVTLPSVG